MVTPGRVYENKTDYRYSINGQEKTSEIASNSTTAEYWQYDSRLAIRWNTDPKSDATISPYSSFARNPIWFNDPLGDTIKIYGNAEVTNTTLLDKGGISEASGIGNGGASIYKNAKISPVFDKDNKLVGYNIYDTKNSELKHPILQLEGEKELASFKQNYYWQFGGAQLYYSNGEPSEGMKKMSASFDIGSFKLAFEGALQENKEFWSDPTKAIPALVSFAHIGVSSLTPKNLINIRSVSYRSMGTIEVEIKNMEVLKYLQKQQKTGTWLKVYDAAYINGKRTEVHYFLHKETGMYYDSKIKQAGWSKQFLKGKYKILE
jgi:hypothetical protein